MPQLTTYGVVREILASNMEMDANEAIRRAKARGLRAPDPKIREAVHSVRSEARRKAKASPSAARETVAPKEPAVAPASPDLGAVFANVNLVNRVVGVAGGVENARQVAEAVRACGTVDTFLQHLELVAGIRTPAE